MDGAGRDPWFSYLTVRHEEACGHMAHAIGKLTDSMAMCFATVGPGTTNMVPGVAAAWADNIPLLQGIFSGLLHASAATPRAAADPSPAGASVAGD